jgi:hypothetical protein
MYPKTCTGNIRTVAAGDSSVAQTGVEGIVSYFMKLSKQHKIYSGNTLW